MRAAVVEAPERLAVREVAAPSADGRQALVAVERVGICGTDIGILSGKIAVTHPRVLGHEIVGRVLSPSGPDGTPVGTRVLVNPSVSCGRCAVCLADREHLCPHGALMGRDVDGGAADRIAVDERQLLPLPEGIGLDEAALLQVLGTCVHAHTRVEAFPGDTAAVVGLGVSGLLMVQLLRARGVRRIVGVTRASWKAALATRFGASAVVPPDEAVEAVRDLGGHGAGLVIEAAGTVATLRQAVALAGFGATIVAFGTPGRDGELPLYELYAKELTVQWPRAARGADYARAIALVADGLVDPRGLLTSRYGLEDAPAAFAAVREPDQLKVVLDPEHTA